MEEEGWVLGSRVAVGCRVVVAAEAVAWVELVGVARADKFAFPRPVGILRVLFCRGSPGFEMSGLDCFKKACLFQKRQASIVCVSFVICMCVCIICHMRLSPRDCDQ